MAVAEGLQSLFQFLNQSEPELVWLIQLLACYVSIIVLFRLFGKEGLFCYICIAIVAANIQVMKMVQFNIYPDPIPLGTILFTSTFLCTDILSECYGPKTARKAVWLGFGTFLTFTIMMLITIGFPPLAPSNDPALSWGFENHEHIRALFSPAPTLFVAGMIAYLTSQIYDVWIYDVLKKWTKGKRLWLRNNISTWSSSLLDSIVFSTLAWYIFALQPVDLTVLIFSYILGTYFLRVVIAFLDTPFIYIATRVKNKKIDREKS